MIVEWFLEVVRLIVVGLTALLPSFDPPSWWSDADSTWNTFIGYFRDMGTWMPVGLMVTVTLAILACVAVGFAIKALRIVLSFGTAGGGSAG